MPHSVNSIIANREFHTIPSTTTVKDAAIFLEENKIGAVSIVDDGVLKGILTERDMVFRVMAAGKQPEKTYVADVMTCDPVTIPKTESLTVALEEMQARKFRHVPVMDNGKAIGMISARDMMEALHAELQRELQEQDAMIFGAPIN